MSKTFIQFKRRAFVIRLIKTLLVGFALALLLGGTLTLLFKFEVIALKPLFAWLIGLGAAVISGAAVWFIERRSDGAFARLLDKKFTLKEKVQTMLEYEGEGGAMFSLQREDAEKSLSEISVQKLKFKGFWAYAAAFVLSLAVAVTSVVLNPVKPPPPVEPVYDPPFAITETQKKLLQTLINDVGDSAMQSPYRENVVASLEDLLVDLTAATTESQKEAAVEESMTEILAETDASSWAVEIMEGLWNTGNENLKTLATSLNYYDWASSYDWFTNEDGSAEVLWEGERDGVANFKNGFVHESANTDQADESVMTADTAERIALVGANIPSALASSGAPNTDPLYAWVYKLNANGEGELLGLSALAEQAETLGYGKTLNEISETLTAMETELYDALEQNCINTSTGEYAARRIASIFSHTSPKFKRPSFNETSSDGAGGDGNSTPPMTDSENVYGSDEKVLDPTTGEYVSYGEIFGTYDSYKTWALENGDKYTEEDKELIKKYFEILNGGFEEEEVE